MRIGIDARMIDWGGVGRYTANLLRAFSEMGSDHTFVLFCLSDTVHLVPDAPNFEKRMVKQPVFSMPGQLSWAREIADSKIDLFHSPHFPVPLLFRGRMIVTIHDVIPLLIPESMPSRASQIYFQTMTRLAMKRAEWVITVSQASKNDIVAKLGVEPDRIKVIYEAADRRYAPIPKDKAVQIVSEKYGLKSEFFLYVGVQKPHKNVDGLIKAYAGLDPVLIEKYPLAIAGAEDKRFPQARNAAKLHKVRRSVQFLGFVDETDLPALYSAARVLVYPSLREGFGFPPLEAMACDTPVIASNTSCLPEILDDAACLVSPEDTAALTDSMNHVLTDESFVTGLVAKGREQVKKYSWERAARETLDVYRDFAGP